MLTGWLAIGYFAKSFQHPSLIFLGLCFIVDNRVQALFLAQAYYTFSVYSTCFKPNDYGFNAT